MKFSVLTPTQRPTSQALLFALFAGDRLQQHPFFRFLSLPNRRYLQTFVRQGFKNAAGEVDFVVFPSGKPPLAFLVGLGKRSAWSSLRRHRFFRRLVSISKSQKVRSLAIHLPSLLVSEQSEEALGREVAENLALASYRFGKYKKKPENTPSLAAVEFITTDVRAVRKSLRSAKIVGRALDLCRDLANTPGSDMTPQLLAKRARSMAREMGIACRVLDREGIKKERMQALLGVARGSTQEPRFIILEYQGAKRGDQPLVFVGKGVTFDSGGINLKPSQAMQDMHMDMSGGAAVLAAIQAIAELRLPINAISLIPAVENMPSGNGYRPGDVLVSRSGTTIEIGDTDAEGRVILADALDFAQSYKPRLIVDVATLTGAAMVALGYHYIGLFTPDEIVAKELLNIGQTTGDVCWHLPVGEEFDEEVKGTIADLSNIGKLGRFGGASHGAVFLQHFAGKYPWAHLDIAPTMTSVDAQSLPKGATGTGVRLLVGLAEAQSKQEAHVTIRS